MPLQTPTGTVCFPCVFQTSERSGRYELLLVFPPDADLTVIENEIGRAIKEAFGTKVPRNLKYPIHDVSDSDALSEQHPAGSRYVRFKTKRRPKVFDGSCTEIESEEGFYPGCLARAQFSAYAGTHPEGGPYAILNFSGVQRTGAGKRIITGDTCDADSFEKVEETCSDLY